MDSSAENESYRLVFWVFFISREYAERNKVAFEWIPNLTSATKFLISGKKQWKNILAREEGLKFPTKHFPEF